ncbi:MAG: hypothetical protein R3E57_08125 [Porticoccaceae bacterium]
MRIAEQQGLGVRSLARCFHGCLFNRLVDQVMVGRFCTHRIGIGGIAGKDIVFVFERAEQKLLGFKKESFFIAGRAFSRMTA